MAKALQHPQYLAHRFVAIHRSNWTPGRGGNKPQFVVLHIMQGTYNGSISWAQNPASNVSWHYAVARDGHTTQNLGEHQTAWTNSNFWYNQRAVTIEHGGYVSQGGPTEAQLHASAKITAGICYRYGIPVNRKRILGHYQIPGANKPCPGANWPWKKYIQLVKAYRYPKADKPTKPPVQSDTVFRVIAGSFSERSGANARARQIQNAGFPEPWIYQHGQHFRVQAASYADEGSADEMVQRLKAKGFGSFIDAGKKA